MAHSWSRVVDKKTGKRPALPSGTASTVRVGRYLSHNRSRLYPDTFIVIVVSEGVEFHKYLTDTEHAQLTTLLSTSNAVKVTFTMRGRADKFARGQSTAPKYPLSRLF